MSDNEAVQAPITDLLRNVPIDARMQYEHNWKHHQSIPVGKLCYAALAEIKQIHAENAVLRNIVETFPSIEKDLDGYLQRAFAAENERDALKEDAAQIRAQERERCIRIIEQYQVSVGNSPAGELACKWTMDALRELREDIRSMGDE